LIDRDGLAGLSMHKLAAELNVRATNLYPYVTDKESLLSDVLGLLLSEVDLSERPGLGWEDCVVAVGASLREMALRHPHAFPLVALASDDDPALISYSGRVSRLFVAAGLPEECLTSLERLLDAHATGYLLLETRILARLALGPADDLPSGETESQRALADVAGAHDQEEAVRTIIAGFKIRNGLD